MLAKFEKLGSDSKGAGTVSLAAPFNAAKGALVFVPLLGYSTSGSA